MDKIAKKYKKCLNFLASINIAIGFIGMATIIFLLVYSCYKMAVMPVVIKTPPIMPLLPWIAIPGLPKLYFTYWIVSLFFLALVHEGSHGIFSRLNKVKIKSSGFGFLGPVALAFVEPDEKQVVKKSNKAQLSIFSAGPVANFAFAAIMFAIISLIFNPIYINAVGNSNTIVASVMNESPAYKAGLKAGDFIKINESTKIKDFLKLQLDLKPNQTISFNVNEKDVKIVTGKNPSNETIGYIGLAVEPEMEGVKKTLPYLSKMLFWIYITNVFVGLFNLMPFPIADGGRMVYVAALSLTKSKKKAEKVTKVMHFSSLFILFMIFLVWVIRII